MNGQVGIIYYEYINLEFYMLVNRLVPPMFICDDIILPSLPNSILDIA